ncbi:unnamed protein product [Phaedon cochleariae]|uniref:Mitochondrial cardiolipin hydrolase n=1 Tax=Phaedon cochleariae TaxID=80249 RepID=A0A9N9SEE7_PHACE|nr:unnamed protein product [Phaedon cochleariae]
MIKSIPSIIFLSVSLPLLLSYIFKKKYKKMINPQVIREEKYYHQVIFVNMENFQCRQHLLDKKECGEKCSYAYQKTLQNFIRSAQISICMSVYMLTLKHLNYELIQAHNRGVIVRVITDRVMLQVDPSQINFSRLKRSCVPFKVQPTNNHGMMHHKFCLIDKENPKCAKMFFGSLNLTSQGLVSNFESVILTNNLNIINRYCEEFEEMWSTFEETH